MSFSSNTSSAGCEVYLLFGKRLEHPSSSGVVFRPNLFLKITSLLSSGKSDIVRREAMNFSSTTSPPGCEADLVFGKRLQHPSSLSVAFLIFLIIFNIITFPITAVLNALVMISVKAKSRLRAHKSNILLAFLALTDFTIGILVQPTFAAVLIMLLLDEPRGYCLLQVLRFANSVVVVSSLFHLVLLSGERYIAMKHPFYYVTLVTDSRLLVASALAWFLSVFQTVLLFLMSKTMFLRGTTISVSVSLAVIFFCHVTVCFETRRHEKQLAAQQTTPEAREEFEKNKKAVKLTSIILAALLLCFIPGNVANLVVSRFGGHVTDEIIFLFAFLSLSLSFLNSSLNPIIYVLKMKQFRVAFIELLFRTVNTAAAEETEIRFFGVPNAVGRVNREKTERGQNEQAQQDVSEENL